MKEQASATGQQCIAAAAHDPASQGTESVNSQITSLLLTATRSFHCTRRTACLSRPETSNRAFIPHLPKKNLNTMFNGMARGKLVEPRCKDLKEMKLLKTTNTN